MRILPPRTAPATTPSARRHAPPGAPYREYRSCLRWDFGFTCAFCLLHESDLRYSAESLGLAVMWVEHRMPRSTHPAMRDIYDNCIYTCRLCNRARGTEPVEDEEGRRLLDPTQDSWAKHFTARDNRLECRPSDRDALYTHVTYDLDDERKQRMRHERYELLSECLTTIRDGLEKIEQLLAIAENASAAQRNELINAAEFIQRQVEHAIRDLERHAAVPLDCDHTCHCGVTEHHCLPAWLDSQTFELPQTR